MPFHEFVCASVPHRCLVVFDGHPLVVNDLGSGDSFSTHILICQAPSLWPQNDEGTGVFYMHGKFVRTVVDSICRPTTRAARRCLNACFPGCFTFRRLQPRICETMHCKSATHAPSVNEQQDHLQI